MTLSSEESSWNAKAISPLDNCVMLLTETAVCPGEISWLDPICEPDSSKTEAKAPAPASFQTVTYKPFPIDTIPGLN